MSEPRMQSARSFLVRRSRATFTCRTKIRTAKESARHFASFALPFNQLCTYCFQKKHVSGHKHIPSYIQEISIFEIYTFAISILRFAAYAPFRKEELEMKKRIWGGKGPFLGVGPF